MSPHTLALYTKYWSLFKEFCKSLGVSPLPASSLTVEAYMTFHVTSKASTTLPQVLAAITHYHARDHLPSPAQSTGVLRAMEGAKRGYGQPTVPRAVMTPEILCSAILLATKPSTSFVVVHTVWRMLIEFYGLLRFREVAELLVTDFTFDSHGCHIYIKRSKTDQRGVGASVRILYHTDPAVCPVRFTKMYIARLGYTQESMLPSLKGVTPCSNTPLSYHTAFKDLRKVLKNIGIDGSLFGEHSGRRGGTTCAAAAGVSHTALKQQGRWKSDASVERYTENSVQARHEFASALARRDI